MTTQDDPRDAPGGTDAARPPGEAPPPGAARGTGGVNRGALIVGLLIVLPLVAVLFLNLGRDPRAIPSPLLGRPAPAFRLAAVGGGEPVSLADYRGKTVVVNFWATWCAPCFQEHPVLVEAARALAPDVAFVGIVYEDSEENVEQFLAEQGRAYPSLLDPDGKTAIAFGITGVPETFFIDPQGRIASKYEGPIPAPALRTLVRKAAVPAQ